MKVETLLRMVLLALNDLAKQKEYPIINKTVYKKIVQINANRKLAKNNYK